VKRAEEVGRKLRGYCYYRPCEGVLIVWISLFRIINDQRQIPHVLHKTGGKGKGKVRLWLFQHLCLEGVLYS
jgi:hypothetical protein